MEYIGLIVIIIIITLLWFVNYQNHGQNQKIERLTKQIDELIYAVGMFAPNAARKKTLIS